MFFFALLLEYVSDCIHFVAEARVGYRKANVCCFHKDRDGKL